MSKSYMILFIITIILSAYATLFAADYKATVRSLGKCDSKQKASNVCKKVSFELDDKKILYSTIDRDTAIYDKDGICFDLNEGDAPHYNSKREELKAFIKIVSKNLEPGTKVSLSNECTENNKCRVSEITVLSGCLERE